MKERTRNGVTAVYRHPLLVRISHWVNALCLLVLLLSGLQILNAHPAFYWGEVSTFDHPWIAFEGVTDDKGDLRGQTRIGGLTVDTTGVLGASKSALGGEQLQARGFPAWLTLPGYLDLGAGRRWHFAFAWALVVNGLAYLAFALWSGRVKGVLAPSRAELTAIPATVWDHLRLRFDHGGAYNVLQKLSYLAVIFGLLPLMVVTGLAMSPTVHASLPIFGDLFGGRQSARTVHFLVASSLVAFFLVHIAMVLAAGPINEVRSMLTGWFVIRRETPPPAPEAPDEAE